MTDAGPIRRWSVAGAMNEMGGGRSSWWAAGEGGAEPLLPRGRSVSDAATPPSGRDRGSAASGSLEACATTACARSLRTMV